jgi:DNA-binding NarL/FixJ family response regulator
MQGLSFDSTFLESTASGRIEVWTERSERRTPLGMDAPVRLLIADDSESIRRAICELLQAETGITVCGEARNYAELLKIFNASTTDVVLMDIRMPGEKLFTPATIKGHFHGSCLLAMSAFADEETASLAQSYGAVRLLDKAELGTTLIPAIEECVRQTGKA